MMQPIRNHLLPIASATLALLGLSCATTEKTRDFRYSGFLKNYEQLQPGQSADDPILLYLNPDADWASYDKLMIDPVTIWRTMGSNLTSVPETELQQLADQLYWALRKAVEDDYEIVQRPGRGVLRVRVALTEVKGANAVASTISKLSPLPLITGVSKMTTGTWAFVGKAGIEGETLDSLSNQRLSAAVDERAGGRSLQSGSSTWSDVEQAFRYWADRFSKRLAKLRKQGNLNP